MISKVDFLSLELTNACNLHCNFCASDLMSRKMGFMDTGLAKRLLKEAKEANFCNYVVTNVMGEPSLHKGLFEILQYGNEIGQNMLVITNGERLTRGFSEKLLEVKPWSVGVSYHANDQDSHEQRGGHISYEEYRRRIHELIELKYQKKSRTSIGINVLSTINIPHDKFAILRNADELEEFGAEWISFAKELKRKFRLKWLVPHKIFLGTNCLLPDLNLSIYDKYHTWSNVILPSDAHVEPATTCPCPAPFTQCNILWNGDMALCCIDYDGELVYANVNNQSLLEAFNSSSAEKTRKTFKGEGEIHPKCLQCNGQAFGPDGKPIAPAVKSFRQSTFNLLAKAFYRGYAFLKNRYKDVA